MGRVFKYLIYLLVLAGVALAIYAAVVDLPAPSRQVEIDAPPPQVD